MVSPVFAVAQELSDALRRTKRRIVFAESCTAGLVAATLGQIPGISEWFCGSAVVYRPDSKLRWLGVPARLWGVRGPGIVSRPVAEAMAVGVLERTPEASLAVSITGDLGPGAALQTDGLLWIGVAVRSGPNRRKILVAATEERLPADPQRRPQVLRQERQHLATELVLQTALVAVTGVYET